MNTPFTSIQLVVVERNTPFDVHTAGGGGKEYSLHVHTAGGGGKEYSLDVHTAGGGGKAYSLHVHTADGGGKAYSLHPAAGVDFAVLWWKNLKTQFLLVKYKKALMLIMLLLAVLQFIYYMRKSK
jgi:hypothetical protein